MRKKWTGWDKVEDGAEVPIVFVLNMDIAKSKRLASKTHPVVHHKRINEFQEKVEKIMNDCTIYKGDWSGDGLVALYKHPNQEADVLIQKTLDVVNMLSGLNEKVYFSEPVGLRTGIAVGTIIFQKRIGGITSNVMKKAGLLQKSCPGKGGILMTDGAYGFIKSHEIKERFNSTLLTIGQEIRSVFYHPQVRDEKIPAIITETGAAKDIDLSKLFDGEAIYSDLERYLSDIEKASMEVQEVVLTGKAPTWLYLYAVLRLKGKIRRLLYRDGRGYLFEILDQTLS